MTYLVSKAIELGEKRKIRALTLSRSFKIIQGHRGRYQSKARMRLPISVTDILSRTVAELPPVIVQIMDTMRF